jgi:cellulose synthase/poly-beta-1,6-N-acetylglucosamine synthase-like glycosyltransferase
VLVESLGSKQVMKLVREGWCSFGQPPVGRGHLATDDRSTYLCRQAGHEVTARAHRQDIIDAVLDQDGAQLTHLAANLLADRKPQMSARAMLSGRQIVAALLVLAAAGGLALAWPEALKITLMTSFAILFLAVSAIRLASLAGPGHGIQGAAHGHKLNDAELPVYTVLVPLFGEANVVLQIIGALKALNYPAGKLDVKIIVEAHDDMTASLARQQAGKAGFDLITVSPGLPQTKPRALNLALMFARGELVTIYDAEDIPQPMQLRHAAHCFAMADKDVACLQARLSYYNINENWLTRQFTIEYASLFDVILPALARWQLPLPLGGTSNHFRIDPLKQAGGWDAWNVTEDADLGLRLARLGYRAEVLGSTTFEEANCRLGNWLHQRARWLKGWMQTWIVIMRQPVAAWREMGTAGFLTAQVMMAGMVGSALLHPVFLAILVNDLLLTPAAGAGWADQLYRSQALMVLALGYGAAMAVGVRALRLRRLGELLPSIATMPVYWLLISVGGWLALWQLLRAPFHWNKTAHGISRIYRRNRTPTMRRSGAGEGNRTLVLSLGSFCSTIELHPQDALLIHRFHGR